MNRRSVFKLGSLSVTACSLLFLHDLSGSLCSAADAPATPLNGGSLSAKVASSIRSVAKEKSGAIVRIRCQDAHGEVNGTGFYLDPNGTVCTLAEIVRDGSNITVLEDGKEYAATPRAVDPRSGVAFLKVGTADGAEETGSTLHPGRSFLPPRSLSNVPDLTPVLCIGVPRDEPPVVSLGMVTGTKSHEGENYFCVPLLTAAIPLREGEGGAPVLDLAGGLVGMVVNGNTDPGGCRILPAGAIEKLYRDLLRYGRMNPGWVGAVVEEAAVPQRNSRTRIASVEPGSPAESAGLLPGDMILAIGGRSISEPEEVLEASFYLREGETVPLSILRGGELRKVDLHCSAPPWGNGALEDTGNPGQPAQSGRP